MHEAGLSRIVYTTTMEDLVAFNLFHFRYSPTIRSMQRRSLIISTFAIFFFAFGIYYGMRLMPLWPSLLAALAVAVYIVLYFLWYFKRGHVKRVSKMVRRMFVEDKNPGMLVSIPWKWTRRALPIRLPTIGHAMPGEHWCGSRANRATPTSTQARRPPMSFGMKRSPTATSKLFWSRSVATISPTWR